MNPEPITLPKIEKASTRVVNRLEKLGNYSEAEDCLSRFYGTPALQKAAKQLKVWMEEAQMYVYIDSIGNVRGTIPSKKTNAKTFVVGSHYDTVHNAGKYDGPLGILLGIEMAEFVAKNNIDLPFHLTVIAFSDEEGARFNTAYHGSAVVSGNFDMDWLERIDDDGITLKEAIEACGGNIENLRNDQIPASDWLGYFEAHIEQGPVLQNENVPLGLVNGISGIQRFEIQWKGTAGHAGTCPMDMRFDALCAASEFILELEKIGRNHCKKMVVTVGKIMTSPNTPNVIPGSVVHTIDIRSMDNPFLEGVIPQLKLIGEEIGRKRSVGFNCKMLHANSSVICDDTLHQCLKNALNRSGIKTVVNIASGAGHDAVMIAKTAPISMLFIRCTDGISHNPLEFTSENDIDAAITVCNNFIEDLANQYSKQ